MVQDPARRMIPIATPNDSLEATCGGRYFALVWAPSSSHLLHPLMFSWGKRDTVEREKNVEPWTTVNEAATLDDDDDDDCLEISVVDR